MLYSLASGRGPVAVYVQEDHRYAPDAPGAVVDASLERSYRLGIDFVPTFIRRAGGREVACTYGWHKGD